MVGGGNINWEGRNIILVLGSLGGALQVKFNIKINQTLTLGNVSIELNLSCI